MFLLNFIENISILKVGDGDVFT